MTLARAFGPSDKGRAMPLTTTGNAAAEKRARKVLDQCDEVFRRYEFGMQRYCEFNAGRKQRFVPRDTDTIDYDQPITEGIEVREHATLGEFLRSQANGEK